MLKQLFFVSRHVATDEQRTLAKQAGYGIINCGDVDAFSSVGVFMDVARSKYLDGDEPKWHNCAFAVVHPAAALTLQAHQFPVAVFNNERREDGGFRTTMMALYPESRRQLQTEYYYSGD